MKSMQKNPAKHPATQAGIFARKKSSIAAKLNVASVTPTKSMGSQQ
jgi:hypothetical protein